MGVSAYCQFPSPGKKSWDGTQWLQHPLALSLTRKAKEDTEDWYSCHNYPGYTGPSGIPGIPGVTRRHGHGGAAHELPQGNLVADMKETTSKMNSTAANNDTEQLAFDANTKSSGPRPAGSSTDVIQNIELPGDHDTDAQSNKSRQGLSARQLSSGSFLDASAFLYLGCDGSDEDACYHLGDACSSGSNANSDADGWDTPDPPPPPPPSPPSSTHSPLPPPPPALPEATYLQYDLVFAMRFEVYGIRNWADRDGGQELHKQEGGCGALTS